MAAVVVGGVAIFGGSGTVYGAALGALLLRMHRLGAGDPQGQPVLGAGDRRRPAARRDRTRPAARPARRRRAAARGADAVPADLRARLGRWETLTVILLVASIIYGAVERRRASSAAQNLNSMPLRRRGDRADRAADDARSSSPREIDLSVASVLGLTSALLGYLWNHNWPMEAIIPVRARRRRRCCGAVNGVLVTRARPAVAGGDDRHARPVPRPGVRDPRRPGGHRLPANYLNWGQGSFAGTQIPNPTILFVGPRRDLRRRPAPHGGRPLDLRDRRQRRGGALLRAARQARQVLAVRRLRR